MKIDNLLWWRGYTEINTSSDIIYIYTNTRVAITKDIIQVLGRYGVRKYAPNAFIKKLRTK